VSLDVTVVDHTAAVDPGDRHPNLLNSYPIPAPAGMFAVVPV
jgi:hypothetical protein